MSILDEKISEFKKEIVSLIEKRAEAEKAKDEAFEECDKYFRETCKLDWQINQLGFFKRKEKQFLLTEKQKKELKYEEAENDRKKAWNNFKKIDEQFNEVRDRFYKFCSDNGIKLPNEEEQEIDE